MLQNTTYVYTSMLTLGQKNNKICTNLTFLVSDRIKIPWTMYPRLNIASVQIGYLCIHKPVISFSCDDFSVAQRGIYYSNFDQTIGVTLEREHIILRGSAYTVW